MKRAYGWTLIGIALAAVVGASAIVAYFAGQRGGDWTTRSRAAREELEKGIDATQRGYQKAAVEHLERAIELDPRFVAPRLYLARHYRYQRDEREEIVAELREADVENLNSRERSLVRYDLAEAEGDEDEAEAALDALLDEHPDDFLGKEIRCERAWRAEDWDEAETCYQELVGLHTNFVEAYNRLGHIDMAQGHFEEAEVHFRTHLFIAPDQALPRTSLAELLILLGRYEEAGQLLDAALSMDPEFCWAHVQLVRTFDFSGRFAEARKAIDRLETIEECSGFGEQGYFCFARGVVDFIAGDFASSWARFDEECLERRGGFDLIGHHAAIASGHPQAAEEMRARLGRLLAEAEGENSPWDLEWFRSLDAHFKGVERLAATDYEAASRYLREADERLKYWTRERAGFKLLNRTYLARSLELEGRDDEARDILAKVEAVNPRFARHLPPIPFLEARPRR